MEKITELPPLLAEALAKQKARATTPTNQPVTYGGLVYTDKKSADGARANDERALRLQIQAGPEQWL